MHGALIFIEDGGENEEVLYSTLVVLFVFSVVSAFAQNNNPCPGDKEYQFNIIGMKNGEERGHDEQRRSPDLR